MNHAPARILFSMHFLGYQRLLSSLNAAMAFRCGLMFFTGRDVRSLEMGGWSQSSSVPYAATFSRDGYHKLYHTQYNAYSR